MWHLIKRHPIPITAHFDFTLVLTYAMPREILEPMLTPGLSLDRFGEFGFVAIAMVRTRALRPSFMPSWCGQDFFLTGYRIFARYRNRAGRNLRGLKIMRSDTDRVMMVLLGNLMTSYGYRLVDIKIQFKDSKLLEIEVTTPHGEADLHVIANLSANEESLPDSSPFQSLAEARKFAGPLPHTFSYERETNSLVIVRGLREEWRPRVVNVNVAQATFFDQPCFDGVKPKLASAFYLTDIPYRWERGVVEKLD